MTRNDGPARPERFGVVRARVTRGTLCHHGVTFGVRTGAGPRSRQAPGRSGEREARPGEQHGVVLAPEVRLTGPTPPRTRSPKGPWIRSRESATYVARDGHPPDRERPGGRCEQKRREPEQVPGIDRGGERDGRGDGPCPRGGRVDAQSR